MIRICKCQQDHVSYVSWSPRVTGSGNVDSEERTKQIITNPFKKWLLSAYDVDLYGIPWKCPYITMISISVFGVPRTLRDHLKSAGIADPRYSPLAESST